MIIRPTLLDVLTPSDLWVARELWNGRCGIARRGAGRLAALWLNLDKFRAMMNRPRKFDHRTRRSYTAMGPPSILYYPTGFYRYTDDDPQPDAITEERR